MLISHLTRRAGAVAIATALAASCGTDAPAESSDSTIARTTESPSDPAAYPVGPQWRTRYTWATQSELFEARYNLRQQATASCMRARGLDYSAGTYVDNAIADIAINPLNAATATQWGYHYPDVAEMSEEPLTPEQTAALDGTETQAGCAELAWSYAFGADSIAAFQSAYESLINAVEQNVRAFAESPMFRQLNDAWSKCMNEAGFDYDTPADAAAEFSERPAIEPIEVSVRLADLKCDQTVGLTKSRSEFEMNQIDTMVEQQAPDVAELEGLSRAAFDEVVSRVAKLPAHDFSD